MTDIPKEPTEGEERIWSRSDAGATIFMDAAGQLGIDIGGRVIKKPVREWHRLAGGGGSILDMTPDELDELMPKPNLSPCCGASFKRSGLGLECSECGEWFSVEIVRRPARKAHGSS